MCILKPKCEYIFKADQIIFQKLADKKCSSHFSLSGHMAYHAGGRRCGAHPSTLPSFGPRGAVLAPDFCKTKKDYIDQEAGE